MDYGVLEQALAAAHAEAVWAGWGFVAEHAEFAELCEQLGMVFIGPNAEVMRRLSDRIAVKRLAESLHIASAPWSNGPVETLKDAVHCGERLGYPLLLKSATRNGDRAVLVATSSDLANAYERTRSQSFQSYGNPTIFMERLLENARQVRVQIVADEYGSTWATGVRQRRYVRPQQETLIEAPPASLPREVDFALRDAAVRMSREAGFSNVGSVSFLHQPDQETFAFLEMTTSLGADHAVSECVAGLDLVKLQIHIAMGGRLPERLPCETGHAIETQIRLAYADQKPRKIECLRFENGAGLRVDCGVMEGEYLPPYDNTIASVTAWGATRKEALSRLARAVRDSVIVAEAATTNKSALLECLNKEFPKNEAGAVLSSLREAALVAAGIEVYEGELAKEVSQFYASAERGRPQVSPEVGRNVELLLEGQRCSMTVFRTGPEQYRIQSGATVIEASLERADRFEFWLSVLGQRYRVVAVGEDSRYRIEVNGVSYQVDRGDRGILRAPAPAVVVSVAVKAGDRVEAGDRLAVLEAMKLEIEVNAEFAGWVRQVMIIPNVQVEAGAPLLQIDAEIEPVELVAEMRIFEDRPIPADDSAPNARVHLQELKRLMLGYDVDAGVIGRRFAEKKADLSGDRSSLRQLQDEILNIFVDIQSLFCRHPEPDSNSSAESPSAEMCLFTYLSHLRASAEMRKEELPSSTTNLLQKALRYYGVHSLDRTKALEEGLFWIYKSHQRSEQQAGLLVQIFENLLGEADGSTGRARVLPFTSRSSGVDHARLFSATQRAGT